MWIKIALSIVSTIVLCLMVYINIHAWNHNVADDISHSNGLLRMLEQSVSGSGPPIATNTKPPGIDNNDDINSDDIAKSAARVTMLEKNVEEMLQQIENEQHLLGDLLTKKKQKQKNGKLKDKASAQKKSERVIPIIKEERTAKENKQSTQQQQQQQSSDKKKTGMNILLLYADDWTHSTLSAYHKTQPLNTILKTPILDALAADGIRFTHNCVTTSVCWISRATLYTGQYMSRHNTKEPCCWSGMKKPKQKLNYTPADWTALSFYEILARNGYHVGHAGKWGVYLPFDKNVHFNVEEDGWHYRKLGKKMWHITEKNEADALRFLVTRPKDKPFFLNVAFYATHAKDGDVRQYMPQNSSMSMYVDDEIPLPATATQEAWEKMPPFFNERNEGRTRWHWRYENHTLHQTMMKNYYRMATEVDTACGAILEELRRQGELDNTMIIFTTDNGNFHAEHGLADKWYPHQESIRVPLIIRDPRMKDEKKGTTNDDFTLNIDLAPTILAAAGIQAPEKFMGRDMSTLYLNPDASDRWRDEFFYEHPIISRKDYIPSSEALVRKDYKYMYWPDYKYEQLFDLVNDPGELDDIFNHNDTKTMSIKEDMKRRFQELKNIVKSGEIVTL